MTEDEKTITLPIETRDLGEPIMGSIMAVVWGLLTGLLLFAGIAEGLNRGFDRSWWIFVPALLLGWFCLRALESALGREFYTISADEVRARVRVLRAWREWTEPIGNYGSVEISSERRDVGQGAASGSFTATLIHSRDSYRNVRLTAWSWSRHSDFEWTELEAVAEAYARQVMELLDIGNRSE